MASLRKTTKMRPSAPPSVLGLLSVVGLLAGGLSCGSDTSAPPVNACQSPVVASQAAPPEAIQHFPSQTVGSSISFAVPANTASITIVEQAVNAPATITYRPGGSSAQTIDNTAVPLEVHDPSGGIVYNDNTNTSALTPDQLTQQKAFFASNSPTIGTLTMPNTTGGLAMEGANGLPAGTWTAIVSDYGYECTFQQAPGATCTGGSSQSVYDVTVITKPTVNGAIQTSGQIDVVVYFATTIATSTNLTPLSAANANAQKDPDLPRMEKTLKQILGNAGITVNSVTYVDLPSSVQQQYASGVNIDQTGDCSPIAELFKYGEDATKLNIFFVSSFQSNDPSLGDVGTVVGIDGTIPGPSTIGGSGGSGAAVATHDLRVGHSVCVSNPNSMVLNGTSNSPPCGADITAYIIAHESGHFLGLYHVTEASGAAFDPLLDTPMCACSTCKQSTDSCSTHNMQVSECTGSNAKSGCGGGDNLMFYLLDNGSAGTLSAQQGLVMRANALVH